MIRGKQHAVTRVERGLQRFDVAALHRVNPVRLAQIAARVEPNQRRPEVAVHGWYKFVGLFDDDVLHGDGSWFGDEGRMARYRLTRIIYRRLTVGSTLG